MLHNNTSSDIQQAGNSEFEQLFPEMKHEVLAHMPVADIFCLGTVSKTWCTFVAKELDYKQLIIRISGIPLETLIRFARYAGDIDATVPISFAKIFDRLYYWSKVDCDKKYKKFCSTPTSHLTLLACCVNHPSAQSLLAAMVPPEEAKEWLEISIQMHANHSARYFLDGFPQLSSGQSAELASFSGNAEMLLYLLQRQPGLYTDNFLMTAVRLNQVELALNFLQNFRRNFDSDGYRGDGSWPQSLLEAAAKSGNVGLFCQLLEYCQETHGYGINASPERILAMAILSAQKEMVSYLVDTFPTLVQHFTISHISLFVSSCSIESLALCYALKPNCFEEGEIYSVDSDSFIWWVLTNLEKFPLVDEKVTFNIAPTVEHLVHVMAYNKISFHQVRYIIDHYNIVPDREIFNLSAQEEGLFRYLLEKYQFVPDSGTLAWLIYYNQIQLFDEMRRRYSLKPNSLALSMAVHAQEIEVVNRLINEFGLRPTLDDIMQSRHPAITRLLLEAMLGEGIPFIIPERLHDSHILIWRGIELCHEGNVDEAKNAWHGAARNSSRHFFKFVTLALANPGRFHLDANCKPLLLSVVEQAIAMPISIPEREAIYPLIMSCDDPELQALKEHFAPLLLSGMVSSM